MQWYVKLLLLGIFLTQFTACGGCGAREVFLGTCETEQFTKLSDIVFYGKEARSNIWTESESWKRIVDFSNVPQSIEYKYYCYVDGAEELECKDQANSSDTQYMIPWDSDWDLNHIIKVVDFDEGKIVEQIAFKPNEIFGSIKKEVCTATVSSGSVPFINYVNSLAPNEVACFEPNLAYIFNSGSDTLTIHKAVKLLALEPNPWDGGNYTSLSYQDGYSASTFIRIGSGGNLTLSGFEINIDFTSLRNATVIQSMNDLYVSGLQFAGSGRVDTLINLIPGNGWNKNIVNRVLVNDPVADYRNILIEGSAAESVVQFSKMQFKGNGSNIYVQSGGLLKLEGNLLYAEGNNSTALKVLSGGVVKLYGNEIQKKGLGALIDVSSVTGSTSSMYFGDNLFVNLLGNSHVLNFSGSHEVALNKENNSLSERACNLSTADTFSYKYSNPPYPIVGSFDPELHILGGEGIYESCDNLDIKPNKYFAP